jgi:SRSO17 transposase
VPLAKIPHLGNRFYRFCERFRPSMRTKTHDTSAYGVEYVSGLLRMTTKRNRTEMSRQTGLASQNLQQFISDSPWAGQRLIEAVQNKVKGHPTFSQAVAVIDESADVKAGEGERWCGSVAQRTVMQD